MIYRPNHEVAAVGCELRYLQALEEGYHRPGILRQEHVLPAERLAPSASNLEPASSPYQLDCPYIQQFKSCCERGFAHEFGSHSGRFLVLRTHDQHATASSAAGAWSSQKA